MHKSSHTIAATISSPSLLGIDELIDIKAYPFVDRDSKAYADLLAHCRHQIACLGACELPNFVTTLGLRLLIEESQKLAGNAFFNKVTGNAYLEAIDPNLPFDHVKRRTEDTSLGVVAYDEYPREAVLRRIYEYEPLMYFIGDILKLRSIYRYADPMGGLNLSVMTDGDYLRWHFDQTDFVTSLAIQTASEGGQFEYVPLIRSESDENFHQVSKVLDGTHEGIMRIANHPGTLLLFKGRHSIHRVSTIRGSVPRLMGLLAYDERPNVVSSDHLRKMRYGRTKPYGN